jgi:hypothetical protein
MTGGNLPPEEMTAHDGHANGIPLAQDPEAFARAMQARSMMAPQPPQRWQCALCLGLRRAWEEANRPALEAAQAQMMAAMGNGGPPPDPRAFLGDKLIASMPQVSEAVTMATIPNTGPCYVCPAHVPLASDGARRPLLAATAGLNLAAFAAGLVQ